MFFIFFFLQKDMEHKNLENALIFISLSIKNLQMFAQQTITKDLLLFYKQFNYRKYQEIQNFFFLILTY